MLFAFRQFHAASARVFAQNRRVPFRFAPIAILLAALLYPLCAPFMVAAETTSSEPISFSVQRGFHNGPFSLQLTSSLAGGTIRYTLDGSTPTPSKGTVYTGPFNVTTTTAVRAMAYTSSTTMTRVVTHSYIFLNDVRNQPDAPKPGWPAKFSADDEYGTYPADYGMDPDVVNHAMNSAKFNNVMTALPSISIVTDLPNLWDPNYGIYYNPSAKEPYTTDPLGKKWERPISMEWLNPDGSPGFAVYGGVRLQGQASRRPHRQPKKNFRIYFKASYGTPKLDFQLFDHDDPVGKFDRIVLRMGGNRSWSYFDRDQRRNADYVNDEFARRVWLQMGNLAPHGTYAHVYLNGMYWGLYNVAERIDEKFLQAYLGMRETDYDLVEPEEEQGDVPWNDDDPAAVTAWNDLLASVGSSGTISNEQYQIVKNKVDVVNLADYFVHVHYIGKTDWPHHNWNAYRQTAGTDTRFKFIPWDNDSGLNNVAENTTMLLDTKGPSDAPVHVFQRLLTNPDFRQVLADRLYKHVVDPTGKLTPSNCAIVYKQLTDIVDQAVIGESARWGDYSRDVYPSTGVSSAEAPKAFPAYLYSRDMPDADTDPTNAVPDSDQRTWVDVRDIKLATYCPNRSNNLVGQYVTNGWYQTGVKPPSFSKLGGAVAANFSLAVSNSVNANAGDIYYTIDGTDPRGELDVVGASATNSADGANITIGQVTTVKARVLAGGVWSPLAEYTFYPPQPFENLVINELHYNPVVQTSTADPDDYEFIELFNKGATPLRLDNASFSRGMSYRFPMNTTLGPGQYLVLASEPSVYKTRYNLTAFGDYRGNLSNQGEAVELIDAVGNVIDTVSYQVAFPWPTAPNGGGSSLSLADPQQDNSIASHWRASATSGGTPAKLNDGSPSPSPSASPSPSPSPSASPSPEPSPSASPSPEPSPSASPSPEPSASPSPSPSPSPEPSASPSPGPGQKRIYLPAIGHHR